jgi:hypothetical protein
VSEGAEVYCSPECARGEDSFGGEVLVVPGTRRALVGGRCAVHEEIPALIICGRCARRACAACIIEEPDGDFCSLACARGTTRVRRRRLVLPWVVVAGTLAIASVLLFYPDSTPPATEPPAVAVEPPDPPSPPLPLPPSEPPPAPAAVEEPRPEPLPVVERTSEVPAPPPPRKIEAPPAPKASPPEPATRPTPPVAEEATPRMDRLMKEALLRIRVARPEFGQLADAYGSLGDDPAAVERFLADSARVERLLLEAHAIYSDLVEEVPEPGVLRRRLGELDDLLVALRSAADRVAARLR